MERSESNRLKWIDLLGRLGDKEHLFSLINYGTAPTLLEDKPATLLNFSHKWMSIWCACQEEICGELNLHAYVLKQQKERMAVLFFNVNKLQSFLFQKDIKAFLESWGYPDYESIKECLDYLKHRFDFEFPHEVGCFLGIPLEDIAGFIHHKGKNFKLCGYWKVYTNPEQASVLFNRYDKAREDVAAQLLERYHYLMQ